MSSCELQSPDVSTVPTDGLEDPRIVVGLAALMSGVPAPVPAKYYPEPWAGIIARVGALPLHGRLEALGRDLENLPDIDVDAFLDHVFQTNPLDPNAEARPANLFSFPSIYVGEHETNPQRQPINASSPSGSIVPNSFQAVGNVETNSTGYQPIRLGAFLDVEDPDLQWCVERIFPHGGASILASPGGWGKSWLLLDLAVEVARGGMWLGRFQTTPTRVLYIDEESSPSLLRRRLRKSLKGKRLSGEDLDIHFAVGWGFSLSNPKFVAELIHLLDNLKPGLIIMDSLIRVHEAEENSATEMAKVFAVVKDIMRHSGATIVFADHHRKPGHAGQSLDTLLRGSSEKKAFVDCLLSMQKKDGALIVEQSKSRADLEIPSFVVRIEDPEPGATVVRWLGDAEGLKNEAKREQAVEFLHCAIPSSEQVARKDLVALAKNNGIPPRLLDETLKELVTENQLTRLDLKPENGPGRKQAFYQWNEGSNLFQRSDPSGTNSTEVI